MFLKLTRLVDNLPVRINMFQIAQYSDATSRDSDGNKFVHGELIYEDSKVLHVVETADKIDEKILE